MSSGVDAREMLSRFEGAWVGHLTLAPNGDWRERHEGPSECTGRADLDGLYVRCDYEYSGGYRALGVLGYDTGIERFYFYWFDSMGSAGGGGPSLGDWEGDTLRLEHQSNSGMHDRFTFRLDGPDGYTVDVEASEDGEHWTHLLHERFERGGG